MLYISGHRENSQFACDHPFILGSVSDAPNYYNGVCDIIIVIYHLQLIKCEDSCCHLFQVNTICFD